MSFSGTQDKCKACDKTVHFIDLMTADGVPYHKTCFKCSHCKGTLSICNYSSMEGTLYCKPHFEQLFKETGSFTKKFPGAKSGGAESAKDVKSPSKFSAMFSGTQDKCASCHKIAYPLEKLTVEEKSYHKNCFRCYSGGCKLTTSSYAALDGVLYCKHHFAQLFKEKGSYTQLNKVASMRRSLSAGSEAAINKAAEAAVAEVPEAEAEPKKKDDAEES